MPKDSENGRWALLSRNGRVFEVKTSCSLKIELCDKLEPSKDVRVSRMPLSLIEHSKSRLITLMELN